MNQLNFKTFLIDFILQAVLLVILYVIYFIILKSPGEIRFEELQFPYLAYRNLLIAGPIYCIFFYYTFFSGFLQRSKKKNIIIIGLLIAGYLILDKLLIHVHFYYEHRPVINLDIFFRLILFTAYAICYSVIKEFYRLKIQKLQIERENAEASLQNLRSQIEPHFIFNSLNSIYALSLEEKAQRTSDSIEELSSIFRYSLKDWGSGTISVQEEIDFTEKYINLNKIRLQEKANVTVNSNIFWDKKPAAIAPLLITSFIENAFIHGNSLKRTSFIDIHISIENCRIHVLIRNSADDKTINSENNVAMNNTRKRLDLLYKDHYTLEERQDESVHEVDLNVNLIQI